MTTLRLDACHRGAAFGCAICNIRKEKRLCPAVHERIFPQCCGEQREVTLDCPSDWPQAILIVIGAMLGGYLARKTKPDYVRGDCHCDRLRFGDLLLRQADLGLRSN